MQKADSKGNDIGVRVAHGCFSVAQAVDPDGIGSSQGSQKGVIFAFLHEARHVGLDLHRQTPARKSQVDALG